MSNEHSLGRGDVLILFASQFLETCSPPQKPVCGPLNVKKGLGHIKELQSLPISHTKSQNDEVSAITTPSNLSTHRFRENPLVLDRKGVHRYKFQIFICLQDAKKSRSNDQYVFNAMSGSTKKGKQLPSIRASKNKSLSLRLPI